MGLELTFTIEYLNFFASALVKYARDGYGGDAVDSWLSRYARNGYLGDSGGLSIWVRNSLDCERYVMTRTSIVG